jgi:hypothetical protein
MVDLNFLSKKEEKILCMHVSDDDSRKILEKEAWRVRAGRREGAVGFVWCGW